MRVERNADGSFELIPDAGERMVWTSREGTAITRVTTYPRSDARERVQFLDPPFYWFGTDVYEGISERRADRNPRQWRLYADGKLVEGPKGAYTPSITFPAWPEEVNDGI